MTRRESHDVQGNIPAAVAPQPPSPTTAGKQPQPVAKSSDGQSVLKRLQSELMDLMMRGDPGISAFPEGDNIFCWKGTITGGKDTVYEGMVYKLSLSFPIDYPFKPPKVKFENLCFHPNVDLIGNICLDILQDKWSSAYDIRTVLLSIQSLLGEPNNDSPQHSGYCTLGKTRRVQKNGGEALQTCLGFWLLSLQKTCVFDDGWILQFLPISVI